MAARDWGASPPTAHEVRERLIDVPFAFVYLRDAGLDGDEVVAEVRLSEDDPEQVEFCEPFGGEFTVAQPDEGVEWGPWVPSSAEIARTRDLVDAANMFRFQYAIMTAEDPAATVLEREFVLFKDALMRHPMTKIWIAEQREELRRRREEAASEAKS